MRISDRLRLSLRYQRGRWALLPVLGVAIAAFCLCFAGAIFINVQSQMAKPYELEVLPNSNEAISDWIIDDIKLLTDVEAATPLLSVGVTIQTGKLSAQMTMTGIDPDYIADEFKQGTMFEKISVMPYIVLNEEALKQLQRGEKTLDYQQAPDIDWLSASYTVQAGERPVVSSVCGILKSEEGDPAIGYISIDAAKQLLQKSGQPTAIDSVLVRVKDVGSSVRVSKDIMARGLMVMNVNNELQQIWDADLREMGYLITVGIFALLCAVMLTAALRRTSLSEQKQDFETLCWMGMQRRDIRRLFALQALVFALIGTFLGIIVALSLPSFLEQGATSSFTMPIPALVVMASGVFCIAVSTLPLLHAKAE